MCNYTKLFLPVLRWLVSVWIAVLNAGAANPPVPWDELPNVSLPPPGFADLETTTNLPLPNLARQSGRFVFSLGCLATPTNNVEVAFGTDENENGELEPEEIDMTVGWDAGRWRVRRDFAEVAASSCSNLVGQVRTLTWALDVNATGAPVALEAHAGEMPLFPRLAAQPPAWLHKAGWNMMRLTGRGLVRHEDSFRFGFVNADGLVLQNEKLKIDNEKSEGNVKEAPDHASGILHSPLSILHSPCSPTVSDDDIAAGWRLDAVGEAEAGFAAQRPANAVVNESWRLRGAHIDGFRIPAVDWMFRSMHEGYLDGLTVCSWGEIRPHIATNYFPRPFPDADLSLLPLAKWGLLPHDAGESLFWHATTPSNSLMLTWRNAAYGRDANCPTNFQAEIFPDGGFVYRYDDRTERYVSVSPWDWDGDGLENSVDPDPKTAGPDAHGTNAEWYNAVCSNVFVRIEQSDNPDNRTILLPDGESVCFKPGVNTNAYYFVDVVAADGPAPVYFNADRSSRLGSPVVMALAGATNHVPLLIGVEYAVTSPAPFTVSVPTNGFAEATANGFNSDSFTVKWPLEFTFTEEVSGTSRSYTVGVEPYNLGGVFSWGGASLQSAPLPGGEGTCGCITGLGNALTFACSPTCTCGGHCRARGWYQFELASFAVEGGECRCGFDDPPESEQPTFGPLDEPTLSVSFSAPAVIFEDAYVDSYDPTQGTSVTQPRRSTRTRLTVSAWGGPNGGILTLSSQNLDKLAPVACGPLILPPQVTLAPYQQWSVSYLCEGEEESSHENDVVVEGMMTDNETSAMMTNRTTLTALRIDLTTLREAPQKHSNHRHSYGIGGNVFLYTFPSADRVRCVLTDGTTRRFGNLFSIVWGVCNTNHLLQVSLDGVEYSPRIQVFTPKGIEGFDVNCQTNGEMVAGIAGGVLLAQRYRVHPLSVSFEGIAIEEVPCDEVLPPDPYFRLLIQDSFFTNRIHLSHTREAKAGNWVDVGGGNIGGDSGVAIDRAGYLGELPRMTPDGVLTTNTAFGWLGGGSLTWKIPFGWEQKPHVDMSDPVGRFAEDSRQILTITSEGDVRVRKLGHVAERKLDGTSRLYDEPGTGGVANH